jgi:CRP-like cAMP-binding protein
MRGVPAPYTGVRSAPLLDLDPDLGSSLAEPCRAAARRHILVHVVGLPAGPCFLGPFANSSASHVGLLLIDGLLGRELLAHDVASLELLGPGDLLRPWDESADASLLRAVVRWNALAPTRLAILDRHAAERLDRYPEIYAALLERCTSRSRRLGVTQAICQLNRVDRRLLTLFWHLAERWGIVTPAGIKLPLTLSHRMLAQLVGARRPSVSTALAELARSGEVVRAADGAWLLPGAPVGTPDEEAARFVRPRRRVLVAEHERDSIGSTIG